MIILTRKIYAFEPVPRVFEHSKRKVELSKAGILQINPIAISNYNGEITVDIPEVNIPKTSSTAKGFKETNEVSSVQALNIIFLLV